MMILKDCFNLTVVVNQKMRIIHLHVMLQLQTIKLLKIIFLIKYVLMSTKEILTMLQERIGSSYNWGHCVVEPMFLYILPMKLLRYSVMKWISKRRSFLKWLCSIFPSPKAQSINIGIERIHWHKLQFTGEDFMILSVLHFMIFLNQLMTFWMMSQSLVSCPILLVQ